MININIDDIQSPADLKKLTPEQLEDLASQLRVLLLNKVSKRGGHVGPNLGFLEATIALHYVFNAPVDKIVFDVSHQTYIHKMLTGRLFAFEKEEDFSKVTGYTNPEESEYDLFTIGHTSTSVALAGGLAVARNLRGVSHENIIAVIGDGSLSGGEAFEGLDFGATLNSNFIVIVNDNDMSIAENHGGLYGNLKELRESDGKADCNYFKALGYDYLFVKNGNDLTQLIEAFKSVKDSKKPVVVHLVTEKGYGYAPAEQNKEKFHYSAPFDLSTGNVLGDDSAESYDDVFAAYMLEKMKSDPAVCTITAGTPGSIGFGPEQRKAAGKQFIDVGIAEQDAVALASGISKGGVRPVFGVVSSFIQRAYDQLSQDVAINKTAPVLSIFYGSVLGMTDVTHLGWFDIPLISNIPGWVFFAPTCKQEYLSMLNWAVNQTEHPVAVRVPGGRLIESDRDFPSDYSGILDKFEVVEQGSGEVAVIAAGTMFQLGQNVVNILAQEGKKATLINPRNLAALDVKLLDSLDKQGVKVVVTIEDGCLAGGFGEKISSFFAKTATTKVLNYGLPKLFEDRYNPKELMAACRLTPELITEDITNALV